MYIFEIFMSLQSCVKRACVRPQYNSKMLALLLTAALRGLLCSKHTNGPWLLNFYPYVLTFLSFQLRDLHYNRHGLVSVWGELDHLLFSNSQLFCVTANQGLCKVTDNVLVYKSSCYRSCRCFSCFQPPPWFDISFGDSLPHTAGSPNQTLYHRTRENKKSLFSLREQISTTIHHS